MSAMTTSSAVELPARVDDAATRRLIAQLEQRVERARARFDSRYTLTIERELEPGPFDSLRYIVRIFASEPFGGSVLASWSLPLEHDLITHSRRARFYGVKTYGFLSDRVRFSERNLSIYAAS